ncbi:barstar family protein [Streptomyces atriruber]|uniref:Barstar family protein n=1 Tax=Streptomyces atriruber TaxID=545121 RepID=A0ABV3BZ41_9ACTN
MTPGFMPPGFDVTGTSAPWVVLVPQNTAEVQRQLSALEAKGGRVHHFTAAPDLLTEQALHRTFAQTLQFPGYYGRNWDALVDCLDDLCGAVTGGVGIAGVIHEADPLLSLEGELFPFLVSVLCQAADRANARTDLDGFPLDRPAIAEHFVFEFREFDGERIAHAISGPDLTVRTKKGLVTAELNPAEWH